MYKILHCILFLIFTTSLIAYPGNKELLTELDRLIDIREEFVSLKTDRINYLKQLLVSENSPARQGELIYRIIEEYANFQSDSAFAYIEKGKEIALAYGDRKQLLDNRFQYAFVTAQSGLFNETQSVLESLGDYYPLMNNSQKALFHILYERLYMNLREYAQHSHLEQKYIDLEKSYNDSILTYLDESVPLYYYHAYKQLYFQQRYEEALVPINHYFNLIDTLSNEAARAYYQLSLSYRAKGDKEQEELNLIRSVIADEHSAVRQNRSLRLLAQLFYEQGEVKRSYRYMQISSNDANFYNTKLRNSQIAEALPIIERDYQLERDQQEFRLRTGFFIISVLCIILIVIALYVRKKRKELAIIRQELIKQNNDLNRINEEMHLKQEELYRLTSELQESDQIKEKYVGHFLRLCSVYILKIGEYRKTVGRKIKTGQVDDLYKMVSSTRELENETKDFYRKFDEAFLDIFPNFVTDFNALLKEDQRFTLKKEDMLNTELRIFALIRIGIKDSSQIAEFLGYNPVTIYSYRTKVKSKAIDKNNFDQYIMNIKRKV